MVIIVPHVREQLLHLDVLPFEDALNELWWEMGWCARDGAARRRWSTYSCASQPAFSLAAWLFRKLPTEERISPIPEGRSDGGRDGVAGVTGGGRDGSEHGVVNTGINDGTDRPKRGGEKA